MDEPLTSFEREPVTKPRGPRLPEDDPAPRPTGTKPPAPPAPQPPRLPGPRTEPPPVDEDPPDRGPVVKPRPNQPPVDRPASPTVTGPIGARWRELGGENWGRPAGPVVTFAAGGQYAAFERTSRPGQFALILWRQATGALLIDTIMYAVYHATGGARGPLGYPTAERTTTHDEHGWFQAFDGGVIVWHQTTGAVAVHGAMYEAYERVHGTHFGYPLAEQALTPDKRAWVQEFRNLDTGAESSIYWTAEHGAHPLYGQIRAAWRSYSGAHDIGYPKTGEMDAASGGRWQQFQGGDYIWHPDTGAHEVHGDIAAVYHGLGGSGWGYPITDESDAQRGGRFNHFRLADGLDGSIYWTPATRAHAVTRAIRDRWETTGWERGHLGFPTGDEEAWADEPSGRRQSFEHGQILHSVNRGIAAADPVVFRGNLRGSQGFGGHAAVELHSDGRARYHGEVTNGAYQGYDYTIFLMAHTPTFAFSWTRSGDIPAQAFGRNVHRWDETQPNAEQPNASHGFTGAAFIDLADVRWELHSDHQGSVTGILDDALALVATWAVTYALGPLVPVIYAGVSVGAAVTKGSWETGPKIIAGTMWMVAPGGFLVGMAVDALARIGTRERGLAEDEKRLLRTIFKDTVDLDKIRLTDTSGKDNDPFTFPSPVPGIDMNLNMADSYRELTMLLDDQGNPDPAGAQLLAHEATHAWHYKYLANHVSYILLGIGDTNYDPGDIGRDWFRYNIEQQATIVEWWVRDYLDLSSPKDGYGLDRTGTGSATADERFQYIAKNIRTGRGR